MVHLHALVDAGNTVVLVEHDMRVVRDCDWVIDIGPGAGGAGGRVIATATPAQLARDPNSVSGRYLAAMA